LGGGTKVGLETVGVEDGDERLNGVERGTGFGDVLCDVASPSCEDGVDCRNTVCRCLDLDVVDGFK
jgi:hypothetical protein